MKKILIALMAIVTLSALVYAGATITVPEQQKELKVERIVVDINGQSLGVSVDLSGVDTPLYVSDKTKAYYGKILAPFVSEILALELTAQGYTVTGNTIDLDTTGVTIVKGTEKKEVEVDGEKVTKEYDTILITVEK